MLNALPQHVLWHISLLQGGANNRVNRGPKVNKRGGGGWGLLKVNQRADSPQGAKRWDEKPRRR